ncbi:MAG: hypothetical protein APR53_07105 [Methanoculleus sp. SDB]|nr:MAG: hypothetical protein APR53_07105 [Methanoculleus sp. SDB]
MKLDLYKGGYFENGKFFSLSNPTKEPDLLLGLNPELINLIQTINQGSNEKLIINLICMPDLASMIDIGELNIYLIYNEAFFCIAFGYYNAGLLLLGQLFEAVVKEIILINSGKSIPQATFGQAIKHVESKNLMEYQDILILKKFNREIRNSYAHYKLEEIIGKNLKIPIWKIKTQNEGEEFNPEKFIINMGKIRKDIESGRISPSWIDPLEMSTIAATIKEDLDRKKAMWWIWQTNLILDIFSKLYLSKEKYESYLKKVGYPYQNIPVVNLV